MYPKGVSRLHGRHRIYGPVRTLPTKTFFYGMEPGEEICVEIDPGKTLEIRCRLWENNEDGEVKVFFELNGQPRTIRVMNRAVQRPTCARRPSREPQPHRRAYAGGCGNRRGVVGQKGERGRSAFDHRGDEDGNRHPCRPGRRGQSGACQAGSQIDAKDLLVELE